MSIFWESVVDGINQATTYVAKTCENCTHNFTKNLPSADVTEPKKIATARANEKSTSGHSIS